MAYFHSHHGVHPIQAEPVMQVVPLRYPDGPGEYERQYRPDAQAYHEEDKKTPYENVRRRELPQNGYPNYKPGPLRWPLLCVMIVAFIALIAGIEWACRSLPVEDRQRPLPTTAVRASTTSSIPHVRLRFAQADGQAPATTTPPDAATTAPGEPAADTTSRLNPGQVVGDNQSTTIDEVQIPGGEHSTIKDDQVAGEGPQTVTIPADEHSTIKDDQVARDGPQTVTIPADEHSTIKDDNVAGEGPQTVTLPADEHSTIKDDNVAGEGPQTVTLPADEHSTIKDDNVAGEGPQTVTLPADDPIPGEARTSALPPGSVAQGGGQTVTDPVTATIPSSKVVNLGPTTINGVATTIAPTYVTPKVTTLTNSLGVPTAIVTSTPSAVSTPTIITLTNSAGVPTATVSTSALAAPITTVLTDSNGIPTATATRYAAIPTVPAVTTRVYYFTKLDNFIAFFLSPILSVLVSIPIRMIDLTAKTFQPFHELTHPAGAAAHESLTLETGGIFGIVTSVKSLFGGHPLIFLTTVLTLCSVLLVPLSTEALGAVVHGSCTDMDFRGCALSLGIFLRPARATIALLAFMIIVVMLLLFFLFRWRSGVANNPWSIAGIASLSTNPDVRLLFASLPTGQDGRISNSQLAAAVEGRTFKLGYFFNRHGEPEYGIVIANEAGRGLQGSAIQPGIAEMEFAHAVKQAKTERHLPFAMLTYTWRITFLLFLTGLLALILYYNKTEGDTPFERFMSTQNFGVRFLFTLIGVAISFFWSSFFTSVAAVSPYHLLGKSPQYAGDSILLSPSLHAVTGIWSAIRRRHWFLVVVAAVSIMSEFMPILLNNVPMRITQNFFTHMICTWTAVGVLCIMWLVVVGSFFIRWPHMPVDPTTVAGSMYYVCDSWMLYSFEGLSTLKKRDRDWKVGEMGLKYEYGDIQGVSGLRRYGVDGARTSV
ncbi:hypothetical protein GE09DRAFT_1280312 [Coniochaeta sp. 2T2.1]|nr:hypothetical protein GE09DRAFT_1280312 [Coniochaeta sp. 2T2.1]